MNELTTDVLASGSKTDDVKAKHQVDYTQELDLNILKLIEQDLRDYEKISVLFLILNNANCYNEIMEIYLSERKGHLISEFLLKKPIDNWQEKVVEALFIIQNRMVINKLGLSLDLEVDFVPFLGSKTVKINLGGKVLYRVFESLDEKNTQLLFDFVYKQIPLDDKLKDVEDLELHALYWVQQHFVAIADDHRDLHQMMKFLKQIEKYDSREYQDVEKFCSERPPRGQSEKVLIKRGLCLIFNEVHFPNTNYEDRDSSTADVDNLQKTFKGLNFDVQTFDDVPESEVVRILDEYSELPEHRTYDCYLICLLSHGYPGGFITADGKEVPMELVEEKMCSKYWRNIVKILIVQACQGDNFSLAAVNTEPAKNSLITDGLGANLFKSLRITDDFTDFFLFLSTMNNYTSIRHRVDGSWFIEDICNVLQSRKPGNKNISINKWSSEVRSKVQNRRGNIDKILISQLPETKERLTKKFYFPLFNG